MEYLIGTVFIKSDIFNKLVIKLDNNRFFKLTFKENHWKLNKFKNINIGDKVRFNIKGPIDIEVVNNLEECYICKNKMNINKIATHLCIPKN